MRLPRMTTRQMMVGVSVAAVILSGVIEARRNYNNCMDISHSHQTIGGHLWLYLERDRLRGHSVAPEARRRAEWYVAMARKYRWAAWQPWLLLLPDPPNPRP